MKKILILAIVVIVVLAFIFIGMRGCQQNGGTTSSNTAKVEKGSITKTVVATGEIEPLYKAEVKSKIGGLVKQFYVAEGDQVEVGQKLVEVIPGTTPVEMVQARTEAKITAQAKNVEERRFQRNKELFEKQLLSPDDYDRTYMSYLAAKSRFYAAMAQLRVLEQGSNVSVLADEIELTPEDQKEIEKEIREALASMTIIAPIAGIVLSRDTDKGSAVIPMSSAFGGTVIMILADVSEKHFRGDVDEADIGKIHPGQAARIFVEAYPEMPFTAGLTHISPLGREKEDIINFEILATIQDPESRLRVGMSADAEIILEERKDILVIPEGAIYYEGQKTFVHLQDAANQEGFRRIEITTGISDGIRTEVAAGLQENDVVILQQ